MQSSNKNIAKHIFLTGSIVAGSLLGMAPKSLNAETLFNYRSLGSGSDLRASLLNTSPDRNLEMKCGSKNETKPDSKTSSDSKSKDGKCGEGKCGDKKMEGKAKDHKCGEGKCGDKKADGKVKTAIVMHHRKVNSQRAMEIIEENNQSLRKSIK